MENHAEIKHEFQDTVQSICPEITDDLCENFHKLWIDKYCNVRIKNLFESK